MEKAVTCDKVDPTTIKINGVTVEPLASYRVTGYSFLVDGGDVDADALEKYFIAN